MSKTLSFTSTDYEGTIELRPMDAFERMEVMFDSDWEGLKSGATDEKSAAKMALGAAKKAMANIVKVNLKSEKEKITSVDELKFSSNGPKLLMELGAFVLNGMNAEKK